MADTILYHKHPLDVRKLPNRRVGVALAGSTHAVIVSEFPDTPDNVDRCKRFVDKHHNNETTLRSLRRLAETVRENHTAAIRGTP